MELHCALVVLFMGFQFGQPVMTRKRGIGYSRRRTETTVTSKRSVPDLISPFRVVSGRGFSLARVDPADTLWFSTDDKDRAEDDLKKGTNTSKQGSNI